MARGDVRINYDTNDLVIEKSPNNVYNVASLEADITNNSIVIEIEIPSAYSDDENSNFDWRTFDISVKNLEKADVAYETWDTVYCEIFYTNSNGLRTFLDKSKLVISTSNTPSYTTVAEYNTFIDSLEVSQDFVFNYVYDESSLISYFSVKNMLLGDFSLNSIEKNNVSQNEYVLLNCSKGSFLQSPTFCVGMNKYINSPASNDTIIQDVVNSFAQDSLRVLGIRMAEGVLKIETEDKNK